MFRSLDHMMQHLLQDEEPPHTTGLPLPDEDDDFEGEDDDEIEQEEDDEEAPEEDEGDEDDEDDEGDEDDDL